METHRLSARRTGRYHVLGGPADEAAELWYVLHGYGQLAAGFVAAFAAVAGPRRAIVAPEGLSRFYVQGGSGRVGASWMTAEARGEEIDDYLAWLEGVDRHARGARTPRATVLGFSQGAATATRWVALRPSRATRLVLWAGGAPPDLDLERHGAALRALDVVLVSGDRDELFAPVERDRERARLAEHGIPARTLAFDGGHRLDDGVLARLADGG